MNTDSYKVYYFRFNGRAAPIRAILRYAKAPFENIMFTQEEWVEQKNKGKFEYGQIPALEYKGNVYTQSHSIEMFLARKFNLYGKTLEDEYEINNLLDSTADLMNAAMKFVYPDNEQMKKEAATYKKAFIDKLTHYITVYQKKYEHFGKKKYMIGDTFSLADIHLLLTFDSIETFGQGEFKLKAVAPELAAVFDRIKENELKEFFEKDYVKSQ